MQALFHGGLVTGNSMINAMVDKKIYELRGNTKRSHALPCHDPICVAIQTVLLWYAVGESCPRMIGLQIGDYILSTEFYWNALNLLFFSLVRGFLGARQSVSLIIKRGHDNLVITGFTFCSWCAPRM